MAQYRRDIAALKRQVQLQQKEIAFLKAQEKKRLGQVETKDEDELEGVRHSARSVKRSASVCSSPRPILASWRACPG